MVSSDRPLVHLEDALVYLKQAEESATAAGHYWLEESIQHLSQQIEDLIEELWGEIDD